MRDICAAVSCLALIKPAPVWINLVDNDHSLLADKYPGKGKPEV